MAAKKFTPLSILVKIGIGVLPSIRKIVALFEFDNEFAIFLSANRERERVLDCVYSPFNAKLIIKVGK